MKDVIIIIPSYNPNEKIMSTFINELNKEFENIVIVNDGSDAKYKKYFKSLKTENIKVLNHYINLGKGCAIKTAFNYICNNYSDFKGVITADCDGQHTVNDIKKCAKQVLKTPSYLVLGVRDFNQKDVPFKSKFGNKITRSIFKLFIGINISDTQTGLRGFSKNLVEKFIITKGERYEYETNMLIDCKIHDIEIKEVTIRTVYINKNELSHFNPITDSIIIYKLFIKYIFSAVSSFILDILLFTLFVNLIIDSVNYYILLATIMARIISSLYNFSINNKLIFKKSNKNSLLKYAILVIIQMFVSGYSVMYLNAILPVYYLFIKIGVDIVIFFVNFIIQRTWVFKK